MNSGRGGAERNPCEFSWRSEALGANQSRGYSPFAANSGLRLFSFWNPNARRTRYLEHLPSMDFVSRHAASVSADHHPPPAEPTPPPAPPAPAVAEEPEYLARYMVVKHSWRGRYKRILCISSSAIITLDPSTLVVTNSYDVSSDFEGAAPVLGRGDDVGSQEFTVSVRTDGRGKFKAIKFSSRFRVSILTELHRLRWGKLGPVMEFPVLHLKRRTSEWAPFVSYLPSATFFEFPLVLRAVNLLLVLLDFLNIVTSLG